ncbi:MAG TPA: hypothetical protein VFO54_10800 [Chryseosolibacter sp.]|nr:hypothetical protein [Chryseosolibacter sp.]
MTFSVRQISVSINASADDVYTFASNPMNLPKWAAGLSASINREGNDWVADSPMGKVKVKFAPPNDLGVLDHQVTLPSGATVYNPMRVVQNNEGSELMFTLYRLPDVSEEKYREDAGMVERDLKKIKDILENATG